MPQQKELSNKFGEKTPSIDNSITPKAESVKNDKNTVINKDMQNTNNNATEDGKNTIEKVASIYDENKPIKGQVDIEGNEVRSMKKAKEKAKQILKINLQKRVT